MYLGLKSLSVEEGKSHLSNVWTCRNSEKLISGKSKSTPSSPIFGSIITDKVVKDSRNAFGARWDRDGNQILLRRWKTVGQIRTEDNLQDAYDQVKKREEELEHALSGTQMELEEMQVMFEEAVQLGEQLREEIRELNARLTEQIDFNSLLKKRLNFQEEANTILRDSLGEARKTSRDIQYALDEANKSTSLVQMELDTANRIQDDLIAAQNDYDSDLKIALEALVKRYENDKAKLVDSIEETAVAKNKLRDTEDRLSRANSKLAVLERKLVEKEKVFSDKVLTLSAEKGKLEIANAALVKEIKIVEDQMKEISERLLYFQNQDGNNLADQITMIRDVSCQTDTSSVASFKSFADGHAQRLSQVYMEQTEDPQIPEIISNYLQITAMAVQLHFPDIKDISTDMLIESVISSPFYLYYDLMMMFMRKIKHGLVEENAKKESQLKAEKNSKSFLARFFRLKNGKDTNAEPKHKTRVKSLVEVHSTNRKSEKRQKSKSLIDVSKHHKSFEITL